VWSVNQVAAPWGRTAGFAAVGLWLLLSACSDADDSVS
jgi:hypothetical protein